MELGKTKTELNNKDMQIEYLSRELEEAKKIILFLNDKIYELEKCIDSINYDDIRMLYAKVDIINTLATTIRNEAECFHLEEKYK